MAGSHGDIYFWRVGLGVVGLKRYSFYFFLGVAWESSLLIYLPRLLKWESSPFFFRGADSGSHLSKRYAQKIKLGVDGSRSY